MTEIWKDIQGYEGLYQVSNLGRVKSLTKRYKDVECLKFYEWDGYKIVGLHKNRQRTAYRVHRLVALAFVPNEQGKPQVNHINGDKSDNRASNLEWCTGSENMKHAYSNGLQQINTEAANRAKRILTDDQVNRIRDLLASGLSTREVARVCGVGKTLVSNIKQNKAYKDVTYNETLFSGA